MERCDNEMRAALPCIIPAFDYSNLLDENLHHWSTGFVGGKLSGAHEEGARSPPGTQS